MAEEPKVKMRILKDNRGVSIIAVVAVMLLLSIFGLVGVSMLSSSGQASSLYLQGQQAFYIAEAGFNWYLEQLENDDDWSDNTGSAAKNFGAGSFIITVANAASDTIDITSTAEITGYEGEAVRRVVSGSIDRYGSGIHPAFYFAMHSFGGHTKFQNSEDGTVNGDVAASGTVQGTGDVTINGDITDNSTVDITEPYPISTIISSYAAIADNTYSGNFTFEEDTTYGSAGSEELWYIDGNVTVEEEAVIYGTIISTGNVSLDEEITIDAASGYPAIICGNNLQAQNSEEITISGLIYAGNNVHFQGSEEVVINGTILSGNNTLFQNAEDFVITYDADILVSPPPFFGGGFSATWDEEF